MTLITGRELGPEGDLLVLSPDPKVRVITVPSLRRNIHPLCDARAFLALHGIFRRERFDVVHTHSSKAGILGRFAAALAGVPRVMHTVHGFAIGSYQGKGANAFYTRLERWAARRTDTLICVAQTLIDESKKLGLRPRKGLMLVPSGFDWEKFEQAPQRRATMRKELGVQEGDALIAKVARFFPLKGHDQLFECMPSLLEKHKALKFLLIGDGILRADFEALVAARGWKQRVLFTGLVPPARVADCLGASDILVHASLREGLPRAIPQAFACRLPVVCYDADGARDLVVDGRTGFLVKPGDTQALGLALNRLIGDADMRQRMGLAGHGVAAQRYPLKKMIESLQKAYGA